MLTAVLSDLHLGTRSQADVLRRPRIREILFEGLKDADRIVLLGDVVELREMPLPDVLDVALPFFREMAGALPGTPVAILAGNHDHRVVADWIEKMRVDREPIGLEHRIAARESRIGQAIQEAMPRSEVELAYPGVWLRPGTYAHHGHYLDAHMTIPRLEAIAVHATARATGGLPDGARTPDDYEAAMTPLYAFAYALAQGSSRARRVLGMDMSRRVWKRIDGSRDLSSPCAASASHPRSGRSTAPGWGRSRRRSPAPACASPASRE